jgi:hypothetical protein
VRGSSAAATATLRKLVTRGAPRRLSAEAQRPGNHKLNHALYVAAVTQVRHDPGRVYYDRTLAEGESKKEAPRALKCRISDAVWRQLHVDLGR